jgi:membrane dipeptidase
MTLLHLVEPPQCMILHDQLTPRAVSIEFAPKVDSSFGAGPTMPPGGEIDPLLPNNEPAPEIVGAGMKSNYSSPYYGTRDEISEAPPGYDASDEEDADPASSTKRALSNIIAIFSVVVFFGFVALLLSPVDERKDPQHPLPPPHHDRSISGRVATILRETPLLDGHNDLAIFIRAAYKNKIHTDNFRQKFEKGGLELNVDLPRLREGQVGGGFWSAFVVCPEDASTDFSDQEYSEAVSHTLSQIDLLRRLQSQYPKNFTPANAPLQYALDKFHSEKSLISPISIEGLHQIPQTAPRSTLRLYHALGVRAATLTWNCHNAFADAALISRNGTTTVAPYHRGGLTPAGREVVREMNRLGILVDISHTSYWTQKAVLSGDSAAPVIYSHSSAFALCPHPRNVQDDMLDLVKKTDSLVMVNFSPAFISCLPPSDPLEVPEFYDKNNTLHQVARHITYIGNKIGYDFVGLGSDFDGMGSLTPKGLEGVDKYPDLVAELLRMGVADKDASKVVGGNLLRVWKRADEVASKLQREKQEGEDDVHGYEL